MRLTVVPASLLAITLALATPALAKTATQSPAATPETHSTTTGSTTANAPRQFKTEAEAKSACGSQPVVWANSSSHVLHSSGSQYFGKTRHGAYMCENTATKSGYHMAKNGQ